MNKFETKTNVININDLPWESTSHGNFANERKSLSNATASEKLGTSLYRLMPGKKACPYHYHYANEEAVFVLEGSGTLRMRDEMRPIKAGDYIAMPIGAEHAHQIINTSDQPLVFLCFSTMQHPDVTVYPDSYKIGITAGAAPGANPQKIELKLRYRKEDAVDYYLGEE